MLFKKSALFAGAMAMTMGFAAVATAQTANPSSSGAASSSSSGGARSATTPGSSSKGNNLQTTPANPALQPNGAAGQTPGSNSKGNNLKTVPASSSGGSGSSSGH
jgi:hypothetical protein